MTLQLREPWIGSTLRYRPGTRSLTRPSSVFPLVVFLALSSFGCSLIAPSIRPTPGAERNLFCALEYRPDPGRPSSPDILFFAAGNPFKTEQVAMSLPDGLVHGIFAPGRRLVEPVSLKGVSCDSPWPKGHRVPSWLRPRSHLLCRRIEAEQVEIAVTTRWGSCSAEIPAGDGTPRCRLWFGRASEVLDQLSPTVCPPLREPTAHSLRGTVAGALWIRVQEGAGASAQHGQWLQLHRTGVDRTSFIVDSTHYRGQTLRVQLGDQILGEVSSRAIQGMRVGERRRVYPTPLVSDDKRVPRDLASQELWFYEFELVEIEPDDG